MPTTISLGGFLKEILEARRMTERTLSQGAGIAQSGLSSVIQEKAREPDPRTLRAIAQYLEIDVFILFRLLEYVPPMSEVYANYSPVALYMAQRYDALPEDRRRIMLHVLESLHQDQTTKQQLQALRAHPEPVEALGTIEDTLPEVINRAANWYLSAGRFEVSREIDPQSDEEVLPGIHFGDLSVVARERLVALLRHKVRQVYAPDMVSKASRS
jgi:transcriptional regulator with XRE-family HTH domain